MFPATLRHVLVPLDFSPLSDQALEAAIVLARPTGARLSLVHVVLPSYFSNEAGFNTADLVVAMKSSAIDLLTVRATRAEKQGIECEVFAQLGTPHVEILQAIDQKAPDLVVMSTHGRTGFKHVVLGSVTERVLQRSRCPVLVLPARPA